MPWRKYTLYNFIGAVVWGIGLTMIFLVTVLVPIVLAMNPRKMAEVLAVMQPDSAERLTGVAYGTPRVTELLTAAKQDVDRGLNSLRATVHGIHPQVLQDHGLVAALADAASSHGPHVSVFAPHPLPELSASVLACGYFFGTEALTNAAKHAPGAPVSVLVTSDDSLRITVVDEGHGGAQVVPGHGLAGMAERLAAFGGEMSLSSPPGGPTRVAGSIPLLLDRGQPGV